MLVIKPLFGVGIILHNNQIKNIKRFSMSKEQTPIEWLVEQICTDVEIYDEHGEVERVEYWNAFRSCTDLSEYIKEAKQKERQFAQAKVLEALEREVIKARVSKDIAIKEKVLKHIVSEEVLDKYISDAQKYYETEVKPKYE